MPTETLRSEGFCTETLRKFTDEPAVPWDEVDELDKPQPIPEDFWEDNDDS